MSSGWTADELRHVAEATELQLASRRPDGSLRPFRRRTGDPALDPTD